MAEKTVYIIDLDDKVRQKLKATQGEAKRTDNEFAKMGKSIMSSLAGAFAVSQIIDLGKETVFAAAKMEGMTNAIIFASGSAEEGAKNMSFLKNITEIMPIDLLAAEEGFKTFSGAVMGTSLAGDKARHIFTSVSKAASVMGLTADDTKGIFLALGQMVSKGTVQAEELKGQLGERLPGAFQLAAKAMGLTTAQLGDYMKAGMITAEELLPRLANELDNTYSKGMGTANKSINAHITELQNMKHQIIEDSIPAAQELTSALVETARLTKDNFEPLHDMFVGIGESIQIIISPLTELFGMLGEDKNDSIRTIFKVLATGAMAAYTPLALLVNRVMALGEAMYNIATLDFSGLKEDWTKRNDEAGGLLSNFGKIWEDDPNIKGNGNRKKSGFENSLSENKQENPLEFGKNYIGAWDASAFKKAKKGKTKKESAGGISLAESRNGATNIIFNIDTFQKNDYGKESPNSPIIENIKTALDQMGIALLEIIKDGQIAAVR